MIVQDLSKDPIGPLVVSLSKDAHLGGLWFDKLRMSEI